MILNVHVKVASAFKSAKVSLVITSHTCRWLNCKPYEPVKTLHSKANREKCVMFKVNTCLIYFTLYNIVSECITTSYEVSCIQ
jgi:hypothetical protein